MILCDVGRGQWDQIPPLLTLPQVMWLDWSFLSRRLILKWSLAGFLLFCHWCTCRFLSIWCSRVGDICNSLWIPEWREYAVISPRLYTVFSHYGGRGKFSGGLSLDLTMKKYVMQGFTAEGANHSLGVDVKTICEIIRSLTASMVTGPRHSQRLSHFNVSHTWCAKTRPFGVPAWLNNPLFSITCRTALVSVCCLCYSYCRWIPINGCYARVVEPR